MINIAKVFEVFFPTFAEQSDVLKWANERFVFQTGNFVTLSTWCRAESIHPMIDLGWTLEVFQKGKV